MRFPLVEGTDDAEIGQAGVRELAVDELLRDDADHLAAHGKRRIGDRAHQSDATTSVDKPETSRGQCRAQLSRRVGVRG